jgi:hypothetical protein
MNFQLAGVDLDSSHARNTGGGTIITAQTTERIADWRAADMTGAHQHFVAIPKRRLPVDFDRINRCALAALPMLLEQWLPRGRREGWEYVALNPTRPDRHLGSFRINMRTGRWADFATGDRGGDVVSLAAYLSHLKQSEAAIKLAGMLGIATEARYGR